MKFGKAYWITAASLLIGGSIVAAVGYTAAAKDVNTVSFTQTFETVSSLDLDLSACKLNIVASDDAKEITVDVKDMMTKFNNRINGDELIISNKSKFRFRIFDLGILKDTGSVTITVPAREYDTLKLDLKAIKGGSVDDLTVNSIDMDLSAADLDFRNVKVLSEAKTAEMSACNITMTNCEFPSFSVDASAYDLDMDKCKVNGRFFIDGSAGDCSMSSCIFEDVKIEHSAGSVTMKDSYLMGNADIDSSAGSVTLGIIGDKNDYSVTGSVSAGSIYVDGTQGTYANSGASHTIDIDCSAGDVRVNFTAPME